MVYDEHHKSIHSKRLGPDYGYINQYRATGDGMKPSMKPGQLGIGYN